MTDYKKFKKDTLIELVGGLQKMADQAWAETKMKDEDRERLTEQNSQLVDDMCKLRDQTDDALDRLDFLGRGYLNLLIENNRLRRQLANADLS